MEGGEEEGGELKVEEEERGGEVFVFLSFLTPLSHLFSTALISLHRTIPKSFSPVFKKTETNENVVEILRGGEGGGGGGDGHLWILMGSSKCK